MEQSKPRTRRSAVYTRKGSEEGLEQNFNSLHAQREACEAFIKPGKRGLETCKDRLRRRRTIGRLDGAAGAQVPARRYR